MAFFGIYKTMENLGDFMCVHGLNQQQMVISWDSMGFHYNIAIDVERFETWKYARKI